MFAYRRPYILRHVHPYYLWLLKVAVPYLAAWPNVEMKQNF